MTNFYQDNEDDYHFVKHSVNKKLLLLQYLYCIALLLLIGLMALYAVLFIKNAKGLLEAEVIVLLGLVLLILTIAIYALFKNFLIMRSINGKSRPKANIFAIDLLINNRSKGST